MTDFRKLGLGEEDLKSKKFVNPETRSEFSSDEVENMLTQIIGLPSHKLNDWQIRFINSLEEQWDETGSISEKQLIVLEDIYARKTK